MKSSTVVKIDLATETSVSAMRFQEEFNELCSKNPSGLHCEVITESEFDSIDLAAFAGAMSLSVTVPSDTASSSINCLLNGLSQGEASVALTAIEFTLSDNIFESDVDWVSSEHLRSLVSNTEKIAAFGINVIWRIPATPKTVFKLEGIYQVAMAVTALPRLESPWMDITSKAQALSAHESLFLRDFFEYKLLEEDAPDSSPALLSYYRDAFESLVSDSQSNFKASHYARTPEGDFANFDAQPISFAAMEVSEQVVTASPGKGPSPLADALGVILEGIQSLFEWLRSKLAPIPKAQTMPKVLLIGAYGGEHIGDGAILGGVLLRIHKDFGTTRGVLMTQRPHHTAHLVPMLNTPVDVDVAEYTREEIRRLVSEVDGVVYAGGPIMDLPKQLVKHLYTAALARRLGKPFIIEGVGAGPFVRKPSFWVARRVLKSALRLTLRTSTDKDTALMKGIDLETGHDPAFDYLDTLGNELSLIPEFENEQLKSLLEGTEGHLLVGINVRPIRHEWTVGAEGMDRKNYTLKVEQNFEKELAAGLELFAERCDRPVTYVFFPMNAIQFGHSDLRSAHRIRKHLKPETNFRIWEGDASLDGVVQLIRKLDTVIAMRFHAAIFSMSQNTPTIGVDYRIGKRYKVSAVMEDKGHGEHCTRIDLLNAEWVTNQLAEQTSKQATT